MNDSSFKLVLENLKTQISRCILASWSIIRHAIHEISYHRHYKWFMHASFVHGTSCHRHFKMYCVETAPTARLVTLIIEASKYSCRQHLCTSILQFAIILFSYLWLWKQWKLVVAYRYIRNCHLLRYL